MRKRASKCVGVWPSESADAKGCWGCAIKDGKGGKGVNCTIELTCITRHLRVSFAAEARLDLLFRACVKQAIAFLVQRDAVKTSDANCDDRLFCWLLGHRNLARPHTR